MKLIIERFAYMPGGTYGQSFIEGTDFEAYTVEQPWKNNAPFSSCVPEGYYRGIRHNSSNPQKGIFAMVNEDLNVFNNPGDIPAHLAGKGRYKCLVFDTANHPAELQGCAAAGRFNDFGWFTPKPAIPAYLTVKSSGMTRRRFEEIIGTLDQIDIVIKQTRGPW